MFSWLGCFSLSVIAGLLYCVPCCWFVLFPLLLAYCVVFLVICYWFVIGMLLNVFWPFVVWVVGFSFFVGCCVVVFRGG